MDMTRTERKVFEAWANQMPGVKVETHLDYIRESMKHTAFHEAGHAAANIFFDFVGHSNFNGISIIPNEDHLGTNSINRDFSLLMFNDKPRKFEQINGRIAIIFCLAGPVAESRVNDDTVSIEVAVEEGWEETVCDSEEEWREQVDEGKALKIAERLSNKIWGPRRILNLLEKWTDELMDIPQVWAVVEKLSQRLIEDGEVFDEEFFEITEPIYFKWIEFPVWKRRFSFNPEKDL